MSSKEANKKINRILLKRWWERNKDKAIAYTIMSAMIIGFIIYLIVAFYMGWDLRWK